MGTVEDDLRSAIGYDPATGKFWWIKPPRAGKYADLPCGSFNALGYLRIKFRQKRYAASRVAWLLMTGKWPDQDVDHKNGNTSDDRWENLREATDSQNMANRKIGKNNTSGVKGVHPNGARWRAVVTFDKKRHYLGDFDTIDAAAAARSEAASRLHGEFARGV